MRHCTEWELEQLLDNQLKWYRKLWCRCHLVHCAECRRALAEYRNGRGFLREFREGVRTMAKANTLAYKALAIGQEQNERKRKKK